MCRRGLFTLGMREPTPTTPHVRSKVHRPKRWVGLSQKTRLSHKERLHRALRACLKPTQDIVRTIPQRRFTSASLARK